MRTPVTNIDATSSADTDTRRYGLRTDRHALNMKSGIPRSPDVEKIHEERADQ